MQAEQVIGERDRAERQRPPSDNACSPPVPGTAAAPGQWCPAAAQRAESSTDSAATKSCPIPLYPTGARQIRSTRFARAAHANQRLPRQDEGAGNYDGPARVARCISRHSLCVRESFRGTVRGARSHGEEPFARAEQTGCSPAETAPRNVASRPNRGRFHAASSVAAAFANLLLPLRREAKRVSAISSNSAGKTSNGYRVTHAKAAASLAARRNRPGELRGPASVQPLREQPDFEPFEFSLLPRPERRGRGRLLPRTPFRAERWSAPVYSFHSYSCLSLTPPVPAARFNKKPAIDWQSRVSGKSIPGLAVPSRDAGAAVPHGRLSTDTLVTQANCNCLCHLLTPLIKHHPAGFVNSSRAFVDTVSL